MLTAQEGLAGFGNDIIVTIGGLFILVGGLVKTGIVDLIGRRLYKISGDNEFLLTALIMAAGRVIGVGAQEYDHHGDVPAGRAGARRQRPKFRPPGY